MRTSALEHAGEQTSALSSAATASVPQHSSPQLAWDLLSRKQVDSTLFFQALVCAQNILSQNNSKTLSPQSISSIVSRLNPNILSGVHFSPGEFRLDFKDS